MEKWRNWPDLAHAKLDSPLHLTVVSCGTVSVAVAGKKGATRMIKGLEWLFCKELLSETRLLNLEKSWDRRDAEETINVREKVVEMTYSFSPNTRMMGHRRKVTGARLRAHKRRLSFGQHRNDWWDSLLKDVLEASSLAGPKWRLNKIMETKSLKGY